MLRKRYVRDTIRTTKRKHKDNVNEKHNKNNDANHYKKSNKKTSKEQHPVIILISLRKRIIILRKQYDIEVIGCCGVRKQ